MTISWKDTRSFPFLLRDANFLRKFAWNLKEDLKTFFTMVKGLGMGNLRLLSGLESSDEKSA